MYQVPNCCTYYINKDRLFLKVDENESATDENCFSLKFLDVSKGLLPSLRQFLVIESPLKMMKSSETNFPTTFCA